MIGSISIPIPNLHALIKQEGGNLLKIPFKFQSKRIFGDILKGKYSKNLDRSPKVENSKEEKNKDNFEEEFNKERHLELELANFTSIDSLYAFHKNRNR